MVPTTAAIIVDGTSNGTAAGSDPAPTESPTSSPSTVPESTPEPTATTVPATATASPEPSPTRSSSPFSTATPVPRATVAPRATATPRPQIAPPPTAVPRPTSAPLPTAAPTPNPTATTAPAKPQVTCSVTKRNVTVGESLAYVARSTPSSIPVTFSFDHGNGTVDEAPRSDVLYRRSGQYRVVLNWASADHDGSVDCRTVTVLAENGCHIGLGPADGVGWQCGTTFCRTGGTDGCPTEVPYGCYIGQDGKPYCIDKTAATPAPTPAPPQLANVSCSISPRAPVQVGQLLVFQASANPAGVPVSFAFHHGDGTVDRTARSEAYYTAPGSYPVQLEWYSDGRSGFVDCGTVVVTEQPATFNLTCNVSDTDIAVGQITVFSATVSGPNPALSVAFHHGDGTRDPAVVSQAVYGAPGVYPVTLEWATDQASGTMACGNVTVR